MLSNMRKVLVDRCGRAKDGEDMVSAAAVVSHARRDVQVKVGGKDMWRTVCGSPFDGHAVGYVCRYVGLLSLFFQRTNFGSAGPGVSDYEPGAT